MTRPAWRRATPAPAVRVPPAKKGAATVADLNAAEARLRAEVVTATEGTVKYLDDGLLTMKVGAF